MFDSAVSEGVLRLRRPGTRWLSTGHGGGYRRGAAAYNVSVPEGFERTDLERYCRERRERAGFDTPGATLLTGVEMRHARGASLGPAVAYATVGLSNPAALHRDDWDEAVPDPDPEGGRPGTVNLLVGTTRALDRGALASLLAVVVEAKAATLLSLAGFPGTTTDAAVVGADPDGPAAEFAGSGTPVGAAARACVREAVGASFRSRYADRPVPSSVADAEHGTVTDRRAEVFRP